MANSARVGLALANASTAIDRLDFKGGIKICTEVSKHGIDVSYSPLYLAAFGIAADDSDSFSSWLSRSSSLTIRTNSQRYC